jgi:hypothetical protein
MVSNLDVVGEKAMKEHGARSGLHFIHEGDLEAAPLEWLVKHRLLRNSVTFMFGDWGTYKSAIAIDLSVCIANGAETWGGALVKDYGSVMYLAGEGLDGIKNRVKAAKMAHHIEAPIPLYLSSMGCDLSSEEGVEDLVENILSTMNDGAVKLLVIDTLAMNFGQNVSEGHQINALFQSLKTRIAIPFGVTILIIAHTGHANKDRAAGSVQIGANADQIIKVCSDRDMNATLDFPKIKEASKGSGFSVSLKSQPLGVDEDGEEYTAICVDPFCGYEDASELIDRELSRADRFLLDCVREGFSARQIAKRATDAGIYGLSQGNISNKLKHSLNEYVLKDGQQWRLTSWGEQALAD